MSHAELTLDQRRAVLREFRAAGRLQAVIEVRKATGVDVKQAIELLNATIADAEPFELYGEDEMGMSADVLAIGPFSAGVKEHMEYPAKFYADTRDGAPILRVLFQVFEGSSRSRALAECFGIDAWNFNEHELNATRADLSKLREMFGEEDVAAFQVLASAGFKFYFRPNG